MQALYDDSGRMTLRLLNVDTEGEVQHSVVDTITEVVRLLWPGSLPPSGALAVMNVDSDGNIIFTLPTDYLADLPATSLSASYAQPELEAELDILKDRLATINDILVARGITQPQEIAITPEPASMVLSTIGPSEITPEPASFALSTNFEIPELVASFGLKATMPAGGDL